MEKLPSGVHSVLVTPFDDDGNVNFGAFESLVASADQNGATAVLVAGSTGEFYTLTDEERCQLVARARSVLSPEKPVLAGANALNVSPEVTGLLATHLAEAGADGLLLLAPIFVRPSHREIIHFYAAVRRASQLPIVAYNNPRRTGVTFDIDLLTELVEDCGVIGLKDSSGDLEFATRASVSFGDRLSVLTGFDTLIAPTLAVGGSGVMSMAHQVLPEVVGATYEAALRGDWGAALVGSEDLLELYRLMYGWQGSPYAVLKCAMNLLGLSAGLPRRPLAPVSPDYEARVRTFLDHVGSAPSLTTASAG